MENIYRKLTGNYDIYKSQKSNKLLYYKTTKQIINLLIRVTIILPI